MAQHVSPLTAIYVAFGEQFIRSAAISSYSLKRHNPWIRTKIYTNTQIKSPVFDEIVFEYSDARFPESKSAKLLKMRAIAEANECSTLYLDCDTYIVGSVADLTRLAGTADIYAAFDTWQFPQIYRLHNNGQPLVDPSPAEPFFNCGVLLVRPTKSSHKLLDRWSKRFGESKDLMLDQMIFREEAYAGYASIGVLPSIYNCRLGDPISVSGHIRIAHAANSYGTEEWRRSLPFVTDFVNSTHLNRVYTPLDGRMVVLNMDFSSSVLKIADHVAISEKPDFLTPTLVFGAQN